MAEHITADEAAEGAGRLRVKIEATGIVSGIDRYEECQVSLDVIPVGQMGGRIVISEPITLPRSIVFPIREEPRS